MTKKKRRNRRSPKEKSGVPSLPGALAEKEREDLPPLMAPVEHSADRSFHSRDLWIVLLLMAAAFVLRIWRSGIPDLWGDEISTMQRSLISIGEILKPKAEEGQFPPLHYLLIHLTTSMFGVSNFAIRLPGVIFGTGAVAVQYLLGLRLMGRRAAVISSLYLTLSLFQIYYSRDAHAYGVFLFWGALSFYFFCSVLVTGGTRPWLWVGYALGTFGMMFTHYMGAPACLAQGIIGSAVILAEAVRRQWRAAARMAVGFATSAAAVALLMGPYMYHMVRTASGQSLEGKMEKGTFLLKLTPHSLNYIASTQGFGNRMGLALFLVLLAVGLTYLLVRSRHWTVLLLFWVLFPYAMFSSVEFGYWTHPRQYSFTQPAVALTCAAGFLALHAWGKRLSHGKAWGWAPVAVAVVLWAVKVVPAYPDFYSMTSQDDPKSEMAAWMHENLPEGSLILYGNYYDLRWLGPGHFKGPNLTYAYIGIWNYTPDYVQNDIRGRLKAFTLKYPEAAFYYYDNAVEALGRWDWPKQFYARRKQFVNWGALKLASRGLFHLEHKPVNLASTDPDSLSAYRVFVRDIWYNTEADLVARARREGVSSFRRLVGGFRFVLTRDWIPLMAIDREGRIAIHQMNAGERSVRLRFRLYATRPATLELVGPAGSLGSWNLEPGQFREYSAVVPNMQPGKTTVGLRVGQGGPQAPMVLLENVLVETVDRSAVPGPMAGGEP